MAVTNTAPPARAARCHNFFIPPSLFPLFFAGERREGIGSKSSFLFVELGNDVMRNLMEYPTNDQTFTVCEHGVCLQFLRVLQQRSYVHIQPWCTSK